MENKVFLLESHLFELNDRYYLYDVYGESIVSVDYIAYCIAKICNGKRVEDIIEEIKKSFDFDEQEILEAIKELKDIGLLKEKPVQVRGRCDSISFPEEMGISGLALHLVHDCNLRCSYCYGSGGSFGGPRDYMTEETATKAIDFLLKQNPENKNFSIIYFGGEPLMNFDLLKKVTKYCRDIENRTNKKFSLGMTTNGTLVSDDVIKYCDDNNISISISIDGPKEVHDGCRKCADGTGSFDKLIGNVNELLERRDGKVTARITLTKKNLGLYNIMDSIGKMGFKKVNVALVSVDENSPLEIKQEDFPTLRQEYLKIAEDVFEKVKKKEYSAANVFYPYLKMFHRKEIMFYNCGAGRHYLAVSPDGGLYLCHRFAGMEEYKLGDVDNGLIAGKQKEIINSHVDGKNQCKDCWARYICGGGCFYNAVEKGGKINDAPAYFCESYQDIFEISIYLYERIKNEVPEFLEQLK